MTFDPARVRAVCFDLDGTLADSDDEYIARARRWIEPWGRWVGIRDADRALRGWLLRLEKPKNGLVAWLDRLQLDELLSPLTEGWHRRRSRRPQAANLIIPGAKAMLSQVMEQYPLALVTARGTRNTLNYLEANDLRRFFAVVATARTQRRAKPHPAPILWAAEQLGVPPSTCAMVGDTTHDMLAAKRAGAQAVGVLTGFGSRDDLERSGADLILDSCIKLPEALGL